MMKRLLTIALLFSVFAANSALAVEWSSFKSYDDKVKELKDQALTDAKAELAAAQEAFDALEDAKEANKGAASNDATKATLAAAQTAFDAAVAKLDARFPSMLCKIEGFVTWPARKAGELLQNKWGARVATAAGAAIVAYCVWDFVNDNADDEADDMRTWA